MENSMETQTTNTATSTKTFGDWLREVRAETGLSLRKLAGLCGISPTYLSRIENGHEKAPSDRVLFAFAEHLEVSTILTFKAAHRVPSVVCEYILSDDGMLDSLMSEVDAKC